VATITAPVQNQPVPAALRRRRPSVYRWTYDEYQRLADAGFDFKGRVELVGGKIIKVAAQKDLHVAGVELAKVALQAAFGPKYWVRSQAPLHLDRWSGPEPDAAVVPGGPRDYVGTGHPRSALLVVEVSDTTLRMDRRIKGPRYARAGYADYWIVNLIDRRVEVYRNPVADPSAELGWRYATVTLLTPPATLAPLAAPNAPIAMADLLP
jgi:Uma2 family endonuclease